MSGVQGDLLAGLDGWEDPDRHIVYDTGVWSNGDDPEWWPKVHTYLCGTCTYGCDNEEVARRHERGEVPRWDHFPLRPRRLGLDELIALVVHNIKSSRPREES